MDKTDGRQKKRREFLNQVAMGGMVAGFATYGSTLEAATEDPVNIRYVGSNRNYKTVQEALASIVDASSDKPYLILVDPGVYKIESGAGPIVLQSYVSIAGVDRQATVFVGTDNYNFRCASHSSISNLTIRYTGVVQTGAAIKQGTRNLADFLIDSVTIYCESAHPAFLGSAFINIAEIRETTIICQGVGINIAGGGHVYMHDCNIHFVGGVDIIYRIGIVVNGYSRIYVFGGKIGTGYGYPKVADPASNVIAVLARATARGRIELFNVWAICRNETSNTSVVVNCVRNDGVACRIRVHGGYYQAEPTDKPNNNTFYSANEGKIEVYGARYLNVYGRGVVSSNQIGLQTYSTADDGTTFGDNKGGPTNGGLILLDASSGPFTLRLPGYWAVLPTEQFIFKKIDATTNAVIINGNGLLIDSVVDYHLAEPFQKLHIRYANKQYYIVG